MRHLLIVDDEPDLPLLMRQKFRKQILSKEYTFLFAQNGVQALQILDQHPEISLVISDINMPEMDGLTLLRAIGERPKRILTLIISAYGDMANIRTAMNLGAFDFVTKPIHFPDLMITIEKALSHIQALEAAEQAEQKLAVILQELQVAARLQQSILPKQFIHTESIDLYGFMRAARQIGGDFYDFFWINPHTLGMVIADVSGKGIPAALFMTVSRTLLRAHAHAYPNPAACIQHVNALLCQENEHMMFVTLFYGQLDLQTGVLTYTNAGHNPPILAARGTLTLLDTSHGLPLGIAGNRPPYGETQITLEPGALLLMYTDGLPEAMNPEKNFLGLEPITNHLRQLPPNGAYTAEWVVQSIANTLDSFVQEALASDDTTLLCLRYMPPPA